MLDGNVMGICIWVGVGVGVGVELGGGGGSCGQGGCPSTITSGGGGGGGISHDTHPGLFQLAAQKWNEVTMACHLVAERPTRWGITR